jgi:hypothetical protein
VDADQLVEAIDEAEDAAERGEVSPTDWAGVPVLCIHFCDPRLHPSPVPHSPCDQGWGNPQMPLVAAFSISEPYPSKPKPTVQPWCDCVGPPDWRERRDWLYARVNGFGWGACSGLLRPFPPDRLAELVLPTSVARGGARGGRGGAARASAEAAEGRAAVRQLDTLRREHAGIHGFKWRGHQGEHAEAEVPHHSIPVCVSATMANATAKRLEIIMFGVFLT